MGTPGHVLTSPRRLGRLSLVAAPLLAGAGRAGRPAALLERRGRRSVPSSSSCAAATDPADPDFVPPERRICTFDNDGTLWVEQPIYTQVEFAYERVRALAPGHPEWKAKEPYKTMLSGDREAMARFSSEDFERVIAETHSGLTVDEFEAIVRDWLARARHPRFDRPYTELIYRPMLELMRHLRGHGLQDLHRHGRRHGFRPGVRRGDLRRAARAGDRLGGQDAIRPTARTGSRSWSSCPRSSSSTTAPGRPRGSTWSSAAGPSRRSATRTATARCSSGPGRASAVG